MNKTKNPFWFVFLILLAACNLRPSHSQPTHEPTLTITISPTETPTSGATPTRTPMPTATTLPLVKVDGLRVAYIIDGNLYVQDSGGLPHQITSSGDNHNPNFSDDGEKIIFYRGKGNETNTLYVINANGTEQRALASANILMGFDDKYSKQSEVGTSGFVPGTHQLLFNTHEFASGDGGDGGDRLHRVYSRANDDLFVANTDTFEVKRLAPAGEASPFQVSSDEKLVSIETSYRIDLTGQDGQALRINKTDDSSNPSYIYWIQNLTKLNRAVPFPGVMIEFFAPTPYTIWQYIFDGGSGVEMRLNPPPITDELNISPDGNWIIYPFFKGSESTNAIPAKEGFYLGNLRDGTTQRLKDTPGFVKSWSSDNTHFMTEGQQEKLYLVNINGESRPVTGNRFLGWLDATHYLYGQVAVGDTTNSQSGGLAVKLAAPIQYTLPENLTFVYLR